MIEEVLREELLFDRKVCDMLGWLVSQVTFAVMTEVLLQLLIAFPDQSSIGRACVRVEDRNLYFGSFEAGKWAKYWFIPYD